MFFECSSKHDSFVQRQGRHLLRSDFVYCKALLNNRLSDVTQQSAMIGSEEKEDEEKRTAKRESKENEE